MCMDIRKAERRKYCGDVAQACAVIFNIGMCVYRCIDLYVDMCIGMYIDKFMNMCIGMQRDMFTCLYTGFTEPCAYTCAYQSV